jgi:hypothetical protein
LNWNLGLKELPVKVASVVMLSVVEAFMLFFKDFDFAQSDN